MSMKDHMNFHSATGQFIDIRVMQSDLYHEYVILTIDEIIDGRFASIMLTRQDFSELLELLSNL